LIAKKYRTGTYVSTCAEEKVDCNQSPSPNPDSNPTLNNNPSSWPIPSPNSPNPNPYPSPNLDPDHLFDNNDEFVSDTRPGCYDEELFPHIKDRLGLGLGLV
jgi:hypothetical protein